MSVVLSCPRLSGDFHIFGQFGPALRVLKLEQKYSVGTMLRGSMLFFERFCDLARSENMDAAEVEDLYKRWLADNKRAIHPFMCAATRVPAARTRPCCTDTAARA